MPSTASGYAYAIFACITNGSFLVPFKFHTIAALKIHPIVFQLYASIGIFISSWVAAAFLPINSDFVNGAGSRLVFVPFGFLGGVIMVLSMTFGFMATRKIGVALAQGIFGGLAIIVSYLWALAVFGEIPNSIGLSVSGVVLLILGISGIAGCREVAKYVLVKIESIAPTSGPPSGINSPLHSMAGEDRALGLGLSMESELAAESDRIIQHNGKYVTHVVSRADYIEGVTYSVLCGILGGTTLVPLHYVQVAEGGLEYIPSFGTGVLVTTPFMMAFYYYLIERKPFPTIPMDRGMIAGMLSGVIWNISNILSVGAIPILGYGVAFPLVHSAILISGLWGILLFKEFADLPFAEGIFLICGGFIIAGAAMISVGA
jgi:glucose uptake protein GlcU